jgi:hypothetical protein
MAIAFLELRRSTANKGPNYEGGDMVVSGGEEIELGSQEGEKLGSLA